MGYDIFSAITGKVIEPFRVRTKDVEAETLTTGHDISGATVDVQDFGADPAGNNSSDAALEKAIDQANDGDTILFRDGEYSLGTHTITKSVTLRAVRATISSTESGTIFSFEGGGRIGSADSVSPLDRGTNTMTTTLNLSVGDQVVVFEDSFDDPVRKRFISTVENVDGDTVELRRPSPFRMDSPSIQAVDLLDSPSVEGVSIDADSGTPVAFSWCDQPTTDGVTIERYLTDGLRFENCLGARSTDDTIRECTDFTSGRGRGIRVQGSTGTTISSPTVDSARRGIDITGGSSSTSIIAPDIHHCKNGITHHDEPAEDTEIIGGVVSAVGEDLSGNICVSFESGHCTIRDTDLITAYDGLRIREQTDTEAPLCVSGNISVTGVGDGQEAGVRIYAARSVTLSGDITDSSFSRGALVRPVSGDIGVVGLDFNVDGVGVGNQAYRLRNGDYSLGTVSLEGTVSDDNGDGVAARFTENQAADHITVNFDVQNCSNGVVFSDTWTADVTLKGCSINCPDGYGISLNVDGDVARIDSCTVKSDTDILVADGTDVNVLWLTDNYGTINDSGTSATKVDRDNQS